jgi:hypothetical protein
LATQDLVLRAGRVLAVTKGLNSNTISGKALDSRKTIDLWAQPYFVCGGVAPEGGAKPGCLRKTDQDKQARILVATLDRPHIIGLRSAHTLAEQAVVRKTVIDRLWEVSAPESLLSMEGRYEPFLQDETIDR